MSAPMKLPVLSDGFARTVSYLRVSLTDRCNYRCLYCMPEEGVELVPRADVLTFEEIERLVRVMMGFGVLGYLFKKLQYPLAPLVLAIVIGDKAEDAFRQAMLMSRGSLGIFFANTLVTVLVVLGIALLILYLYIALSGPVKGGPAHGTPGQEQGCLWVIGIGGCLP